MQILVFKHTLNSQLDWFNATNETDLKRLESCLINSLTAGRAYIQVFIFY